MTVIKKDQIDKIVIENKTDLVNHLYFIFLKNRELDQ